MTDDRLSRQIILFAALCGASGVALGALGAHGLESVLTDRGYEPELVEKRLHQFDTGVRYHLIHAVALLGLAGLSIGGSNDGNSTSKRWVGRLFVTGILLFSGSLYALVLSNQTKFGMITPIGGLSWIVGWLCLLRLAKSNRVWH